MVPMYQLHQSILETFVKVEAQLKKNTINFVNFKYVLCPFCSGG